MTGRVEGIVAVNIARVLVVVAGVSMVWPILMGAPWLPSSLRRVRQMLTMAGVHPGDTVYDLGSGDGRVVVMAARHFGARAVGIEIDPLRFVLSRLLVLLFGVGRQVRIVWGDFFSRDLGEADVVVTYLMQGTNERLTAKLLDELRPGTRVVSNEFTFPDWEIVESDPGQHLLLYRMPGEPA